MSHYYNSLAELATAWGIKPRPAKDKELRDQQQKKFLARHKCRACGEPLTYVGGNIMTCTNEKCKGIKIKDREDEYIVSYELLDKVGEEIASKIF